MPELPEVETIARDIRPHLEGARIRSARLFKPDILRGIKRPAFERGLTGRRVSAVGRRAKHLVIELDSGSRMVIRPGMTGAVLTEQRPGAGGRSGRSGSRSGERERHDVLHLQLSTGVLVRYRDVRRLGGIYLLNPEQWLKYDASLGPEPLAESFTPGVLATMLQGSRLAVKKAIMDQKKLVGVGNIYASEALWMAQIDPSRESRRITLEESGRLHGAIVDVLSRSIEGRGTTFRDYRTGTGEPGDFQGRLAVYGREREPCLRCGRRIVMTHAIDARSSYFCPGCQG
ncbi:MAG TPA: bifunctional DNA-formamidopyrimidine glycosylase/DNA-(apurinic or apyrimidinic site) lyase [Gemmatimonadales bacterium]|jgi:formamidopyrimidine-DNA glycosylase